MNAAKNVGKAQAQAAAAQRQGMLQNTIDRQKGTISEQQETIDALNEENEQLKAKAEETPEQKPAELEAPQETSGENNEEAAALQARVNELQAQLDQTKAENSELSRIRSSPFRRKRAPQRGTGRRKRNHRSPE